MGDTIAAAPTPNPPTILNKIKLNSVADIATPIPEIANNNAHKIKARFLPNRSAIYPADKDPNAHPTNPDPTAHPSDTSFSLKKLCIYGIVPEMIAVSNPNNKPPNAAVTLISMTNLLLIQ
jgi:hypothetical protein